MKTENVESASPRYVLNTHHLFDRVASSTLRPRGVDYEPRWHVDFGPLSEQFQAWRGTLGVKQLNDKMIVKLENCRTQCVCLTNCGPHRLWNAMRHTSETNCRAQHDTDVGLLLGREQHHLHENTRKNFPLPYLWSVSIQWNSLLTDDFTEV